MKSPAILVGTIASCWLGVCLPDSHEETQHSGRGLRRLLLIGGADISFPSASALQRADAVGSAEAEQGAPSPSAPAAISVLGRTPTGTKSSELVREWTTAAGRTLKPCRTCWVSGQDG